MYCSARCSNVLCVLYYVLLCAYVPWFWSVRLHRFVCTAVVCWSVCMCSACLWRFELAGLPACPSCPSCPACPSAADICTANLSTCLTPHSWINGGAPRCPEKRRLSWHVVYVLPVCSEWSAVCVALITELIVFRIGLLTDRACSVPGTSGLKCDLSDLSPGHQVCSVTSLTCPPGHQVLSVTSLTCPPDIRSAV